MTQQELLIVVLGLVGVVGLGVIAYLARTQAGQAAEFGRIFDGTLTQLVTRADATLAPYGERLSPAHNLLSTLEQLVDEPGDWLIKILAEKTGTPAADIIAILQPPLQRGVDLTDGVPADTTLGPAVVVPEQEAGEPGGAVK